MTETQRTRRVFICYSSKDREVVLPLGQLLRASGSHPFVDNVDLEPGVEWASQIDAAIRDCSRVFVFWSGHAADSREVEREWRLALTLGKVVVPIFLSRTPPPTELGAIHGVSLIQMFDEIVTRSPTLGAMRGRGLVDAFTQTARVALDDALVGRLEMRIGEDGPALLVEWGRRVWTRLTENP